MRTDLLGLLAADLEPDDEAFDWQTPDEDDLRGVELLPDPAAGEEDSPAAPEPEPEPAEPPPSAAWAFADDRATISYSQILTDRPDVIRAYYETTAGGQKNDPWGSPEVYAAAWYKEHGIYEGYAQSATTAGDNVSLERILAERHDVLKAYYVGRESAGAKAWSKAIGGDTPEAFAKYWYNRFGKWEGYSQTEKAAAEAIDIERLLTDRPDVFRAFFTEYYGPNNDRHSSAWVDRVGGETVQDYGKYWYLTYGRAEGYTQREGGSSGGVPEPGMSDDSDLHDPSEDPWNHPALFPDWQPPHEGWTPPEGSYVHDNYSYVPPGQTPSPGPEGDEADTVAAGDASLFEPDVF